MQSKNVVGYVFTFLVLIICTVRGITAPNFVHEDISATLLAFVKPQVSHARCKNVTSSGRAAVMPLIVLVMFLLVMFLLLVLMLVVLLEVIFLLKIILEVI